MKNNEMNFEEAIKELEKIAKELESNEIDLDTAVGKFEQGMKISKKCNDILVDAEKRISILIKEGNDYKEEKFVTEE